MSFEQFWTVLLKQWKLIVICLLVIGLGAYIGSKFMTPRYQSSVLGEVTIQTTNNQVSNDSLLASDQLVQTEAQLATSDPVLREVASNYPGLTVQQLQSEVTVTPKATTQLFEIDVLDASPQRTAALANDVARTLIKQQQQILQQNNSLAQQQMQQDLTSTQQQISAVSSQIATMQAQGGNRQRI